MYESKRKKINDMYLHDVYQECLKECFSLINIIPSPSEEYIDIFFDCYYKISSVYISLGEMGRAIKYLKLALKYVGTNKDKLKDELESNKANRARANWLLSYYYMNMSSKKAIKHIQKAIDDYAFINDDENLYGALVHKGYLMRNTTLITDSIKVLKHLNIHTARMNEIYADLIKCYVAQGDYIKAQHAILNISDKKKRFLWYDYINCAINERGYVYEKV